jgi:hypothetical protein
MIEFEEVEWPTVRKYDFEKLAATLYDLLATNADGLDLHEIADRLGFGELSLTNKRRVIHGVIRTLRLILGEGDSINVPYRIEGARYVYFLAGRPEEGDQWQEIRMSNKLAQVDVDIAYWRSMVTAHDGRSRNGRYARAFLKHFMRLREDLRELADGGIV